MIALVRGVRSILPLLFTVMGHAALACVGDVDVISAPSWAGKSGRGYDVFDAERYYQPLTFRIEAMRPGCQFFVTASAGATTGAEGVLTGGADNLRFTVYRDATGTQPLQGATLATWSDVLTGLLEKSGAAATFQIAYGIRPQQVVGPGVYVGEITLSAYEGELGSGTLIVQRTVPITVVVPSIAETSFSSGSFDPDFGIFHLDFNTMHQGDIKGVTIRTRSNSGYRVLARSLHNGAMRHVDRADTSTVPYRMTVDGRPIPLGDDDMEIALRPDGTDSNGKSHRVDFEIGDISGAGAGDYWDVVSITIISLR